MRVVVAGGTGFIGSVLWESLLARGHDVVLLTRDASRSRDHIHPKVHVVSWAPGAAWASGIQVPHDTTVISERSAITLRIILGLRVK